MKNRRIATYLGSLLVTLALYLPLAEVADKMGTYTFFENGLFHEHGVSYWVNQAITWFFALVLPGSLAIRGKVKLVRYPALVMSGLFALELYQQAKAIVGAFNQHKYVGEKSGIYGMYLLGHLSYGWLVFLAGVALLFWAGLSKQVSPNNPTQKLAAHQATLS